MSKHIARGFLIASALGLFLASHIASPAAQAPPICGVDLRVLVMSADGTEADLPAIQAALDYLARPTICTSPRRTPKGSPRRGWRLAVTRAIRV